MRAREDNGCQHNGSKHEVSNGKAMAFEFQRGNGAKSAPSKWDDAQKWIFGFPKGGEKEHSKMKHKNSKADDSWLIASVPEKEDEENGAFLSAMNSQYEAETKKMKRDEPNWRINKPLRNSEFVVRSVSVRDMGTEMTPIASQEPSRTATPVRATTPVLQSPISSGISTPEKSHYQMQATEVFQSGLESATTMNKNQSSDQTVKMSSMETRATAWDKAERAKHMARYKSEEVRIEAWETREKRKGE